MKNKTNEGYIGTILIAFAIFMLIALVMSTTGNSEADQYNEMRQYHQDEGRMLFSDGDLIIVKH